VQIRRVALREKKLGVVAQTALLPVLRALEGIFDRNPFLEAVLGHKFVAEMPFSKVSSSIERIADYFRQAAKTWRQNAFVAGASSLMRPSAGEQRRT